MVKTYARFTVRNPRRTWTGTPPDAAAGDAPAPDLEVADLEPLVGVPDEATPAAIVFGGGATVYLENASKTDKLHDGQVVALALELELEPDDAPTPTPTARPPASGRQRSDGGAR